MIERIKRRGAVWYSASSSWFRWLLLRLRHPSGRWAQSIDVAHLGSPTGFREFVSDPKEARRQTLVIETESAAVKAGTLEIRQTGPHTCLVLIDGQPVDRVISLVLRKGVGTLWKLELEVFVDDRVSK